MTEPPPSKLCWFLGFRLATDENLSLLRGRPLFSEVSDRIHTVQSTSSFLFLIVLAAHQVLLNLVYGSSENLANCGLLRARRCRRRDACNLAFVAYLNASLLMKNFEPRQVQRKQAYKKSKCIS